MGGRKTVVVFLAILLAVALCPVQGFPAEGAGSPQVVFSYDPIDPWEGTVIMYMMDGEGRLIPEAGEDPEGWKYRALLTVEGYDFRPVPIEDAGMMASRICAERSPEGLILVQTEVACMGADANDPSCLTYLTLYRPDAETGLEKVLSGTRFADHKFVWSGVTEPYKTECAVDGQACGEAELLSAFGAYGVEFTPDRLHVDEDVYHVFLRGYFPDGENLLEDMRNEVHGELPKTYEELAAEYGTAD